MKEIKKEKEEKKTKKQTELKMPFVYDIQQDQYNNRSIR